ncbi:hypothetical protein [Caballeronia zhejiangensis]|uniref:Uncharacterized protein n=1 Tax=Caballeronia zhejiangensis TaxID=871203 RepID=A0A656QEK8_9BURK|nr:hypothetical protein [Caballeronia zhejiangensis]KDR26001.1 hypothetical protein BG60_26475 [Caballeronia zhejiangensis]
MNYPPIPTDFIDAPRSRVVMVAPDSSPMIATLAQRQEEQLDYDFFFTRWLSPTDTIASFAAEVSPADPSVAMPGTLVDASGTIAKVWLQGGIGGMRYAVKLTATTAQGRAWEQQIILSIIADRRASGDPDGLADSAAASALAAAESALAAANSEANSAASEAAAGDSAAQAHADAQAADGSAGAAHDAQVAAEQAAVSAGQSADSATTSKNASADSAALAQSWASKPTGTVDGTSFSAKVYASQAGISAGQSADSALAASNSAGAAHTSEQNAKTSEQNVASTAANMNAYIAIPVTGPAMTLTAAQFLNAIIAFTGVLTADTVVTVPATSHPFMVINQTTGAYKLTVKMQGGTQQTQVIQGYAGNLCCDGLTGVYAASSAGGNANAQLSNVVPAAGASFVPFPHVQGFAWLMLRGLFLNYGTDYTDDTSGFYLQNFTADGKETFSIFSLNAVSIANALLATNPVIVSGGLTFPDGSTQNTAPQSSRNLFVDGRFDSWVATTAALPVTPSSYVAATMWAAKAGTGGAGTLSQFDVRSGSYTGDSNPIYALAYAQTTASTGSVAGSSTGLIRQSIEGVHTAAGKSVTVGIKLWVAAGSITIPQIYALQNFGSGGSPSAAVDFSKAVNWVVTTTPKLFSVRLDVPSIAGKAIGTNGNDSLSIGLTLPPGVTFTLYAMEPQCELCSPTSSSDINGNGGSPTPFEFRGMQPELDRITRYFERVHISFLYQAASANCYGGTVLPMARKRATPALAYSFASFPVAQNVQSSNVAVYSAYQLRFYMLSAAAGVCEVQNGYVDCDCRL